MKIKFFSRHKPTNGEIATAKKMGYELEQDTILFDDDPLYLLEERGIKRGSTIAVVAPLPVALRLLRGGYTLIEFENVFLAHQKGVFVCGGAWKHTLKESRWIPCPIPLSKQEKGKL